MFIKVTNGELSKLDYTLGELRRDNPNTSFPKVIPDSTLAEYGVFKLKEVQTPKYDTKTARVVKSAALIDGVWTQTWTVVNLPVEDAAANVRGYRDSLLKETDWMALSDVTMSDAWAAYRQALRDVTAQEGFPDSVTWPNKPTE